jgi:ribosomal protein S18 acetylase RimI-like enzyme
VVVDTPWRHPGLQLRRLSTDDWAAFAALRLAALTEAPDAFGSTLADWRDASEQRWRNRVALAPLNLVASLDGSDVGMLSGLEEVPGTVEVISVWVAPGARGQGVGDAMLEALLAWADDRDAQRVVLTVTEHNVAAQRLYGRLGFVATGEVKQGRAGVQELWMQRVLR